MKIHWRQIHRWMGPLKIIPVGNSLLFLCKFVLVHLFHLTKERTLRVSTTKGWCYSCSQFMHLCEGELTSTSQTSLTHADERPGIKVQLHMSHNTLCSQTSISFILSGLVCHTSHGESTCAFRAHVMLCVLGWCFQLHAGSLDCLARVHVAVYNMFVQYTKLPTGLTFTKQTPSDLILLPFRHFLFKPFALRISLQTCWPLSVSKLIQLPLPVGGSSCLPGLFGMDLVFILLTKFLLGFWALI